MEYFSNEAEKHQNVEIKVTVDSTSELIEKLRDKKLDAVLVLNHGGDPMENDLEWAELKTTEMLSRKIMRWHTKSGSQYR